jgi:toxin-antitoxin system PIN domain toxin
MIAVDTNILVYAHRRDSEWHEKASSELRGLAEGSVPWGIAWPCVHEFLAIVTHPRIFKPPTPLPKAIEQVDIWLESPALRLLGELSGHWEELKGLLRSGRITGGAVHDVRIAVICREHGVRELWSADRDFSRIAGVSVRNPLVR